MPEIYIKGERVPCVNEIVYLGHVIRNDRRDTLVESVVRNINSKFNSCFWIFMAVRIVPCIIKVLKVYMSQVEKH